MVLLQLKDPLNYVKRREFLPGSRFFLSCCDMTEAVETM